MGEILSGTDFPMSASNTVCSLEVSTSIRTNFDGNCTAMWVILFSRVIISHRTAFSGKG